MVVFSHIPPFIHAPNEASGYFPLSHEVRHRLLHKMAINNVSHWFCGHYHRNAGGVYCLPCDEIGKLELSQCNKGSLEVVTTAAVGGNIGTDASGDPLGLTGMLDISAEPFLSGVRVVDVSEAALVHRFVSLEELERNLSD